MISTGTALFAKLLLSGKNQDGEDRDSLAVVCVGIKDFGSFTDERAEGLLKAMAEEATKRTKQRCTKAEWISPAEARFYLERFGPAANEEDCEEE